MGCSGKAVPVPVSTCMDFTPAVPQPTGLPKLRGELRKRYTATSCERAGCAICSPGYRVARHTVCVHIESLATTGKVRGCESFWSGSPYLTRSVHTLPDPHSPTPAPGACFSPVHRGHLVGQFGCEEGADELPMPMHDQTIRHQRPSEGVSQDETPANSDPLPVWFWAIRITASLGILLSSSAPPPRAHGRMGCGARHPEGGGGLSRGMPCRFGSCSGFRSGTLATVASRPCNPFSDLPMHART